jgi:hypothetical protein
MTRAEVVVVRGHAALVISGDKAHDLLRGVRCHDGPDVRRMAGTAR